MLSTLRFRSARLVLVALLAATMTVPAQGLVPSEESALLGKLFMEPAFEIRNYPVPVADLPAELQDALASDLASLDADAALSFYDLRAGALSSLVLERPLVPGPGVGNHLSWSDLGLAEPADDSEYGAAALAAFESFLADNAAALGVDPGELEAEPNVVVHDGRRLVLIHADREVDGIPVRFSALVATINSGNLLLYGSRNWGAIDVPTSPVVSSEAAESAVAAHLAPFAVGAAQRPTHLELIPQANGDDPEAAAPGDGYTYRLAWVVTVGVDNDHGVYEGVVDALSGELLAVTDLNQYLTRRAVGGVYPVSNDGLCQGEDCVFGGAPDGVEQPGHPMPFADLTLGDGTTVQTNSGGLADFDGPFSSALTGPYVQMSDNCGLIDESTVCTDLDFGAGPGTDCDVPAGAGSLGNTHSSRTGFYELNRLIELVRSRTPASDASTFAFVNGQIPVVTPVTSNMNIPNSCNAFFTPALPSINFYREGPSGSGSVICRNTGEIAAVFDHEWGHFLDDFDGNGLSSPSEAYADIAGITRLNDSCVGRGFFKSLGDGTLENQVFCSGNGDPCTECSGVREDDFLKRASQLPHGVDWAAGVDPDIPGGCVTPSPLPLPAPGLQSAPCGGSVHCNGTIVGEAVVDLMTRDLVCMDAGGWENVPGDGSGPVAGGQCVGGAAPTMDVNTALELVTLVFYKAKSNIGFWFVCNNTVGGCNADSGYQQFLAADDDNGSLADGTPHHEAIFAAFDRHQIACPATAPPPVNLSCPLGEPARVTNLVATATVNGADLDWDDVPGALEYWVYRTEGVLGCEQGKTRIAVLNALTDGSQYSDAGNALDGLEQYYTVLAVGAPGCYGDMAECASVVPLSPTGGGNDVASVGIEQGTLSLSSDDGDIYLDNCEGANLTFTVANNGSIGLTDVEVIDIRPVSHPETTILTSMPIALGSLPAVCGGAGGAAASVDFQPLGMSFDETIVFEVDVLAAEFGGVVQTGTLQISQVESDNVLQAEVLFDFEADEQGWTPLLGVFNRTDAGAGGAPSPSPGTFYMASSEVQAAQCDVIRSPALRFTPTSELSLFNQFSIEPTTTAPYDRANVSLVDAVTGEQFVISPDGGLRPYTIPTGGDGFGSCVTQNEPGWNGAGPGWLDATWSSAVLGGVPGGIPAQGRDFFIEVAYGTDALFEGGGFQFDQVTATDVFARGPDAPGPAFCDPIGNLKPDAVDDTAETDQGVAVAIDVLDNDSDPDAGQLIAITNVTNGANGTAVDSGGGFVTYTPDPAFVGVDTFTYTICDNGSPVLCDSATVTITVVRVVDSCFEPGQPILSDPEGDAGFLGSPGLAQHDVLSLEIAQDGALATGTFVFTLKMASLEDPLPADTTWPVVFKHNGGADRFVRMWTDELGDVTFDYGVGTNPSPFTSPGTPADPSSSYDTDGTVRIVVPSSAFPAVQVGDTLGPFLTRIRIEAAGSALTPDNMPDSLVPAGSYEVVSCGVVNDPPVANDDGPFNVTEGNTLSVAAPGVLANDSDANGDALEAVLDTDVSNGTLVLDADGSFDYTPDACTSGPYTDSFTYFADDGEDLSATPATVTIQVQCGDTNQAPIARDDAFATPEDTALAGNVGDDNGNGPDSDPDGDSLTYMEVSGPSRGTLAFSSDGSFTYTPEANFHGTDSFTYKVCDPEPLCDQGTVTITVASVNDAPVAGADDYATNEDETLVVAAPGVLGNDDDVDGDALSASLVSDVSDGSLTLNADGSFSYTPAEDFNGVDSFTYVANDGQADSNVATVTITVAPVNDPPVAVDDDDSTAQDTAVDIDVLGNDFDPDGDDLRVDSATDPANGTAVVNPDDTITYTPDPGFTGTDTFLYVVCDEPAGACDTATVTVTVDPAPAAGGKVTGGGWLVGLEGKKINFGFNAKQKADGPQGNLQLNDKGAGVKIHLSTVTSIGEVGSGCGSVVASANAIEFRGLGTLNGLAAEFRVCVEDNGEPGNSGPSANPDKLHLECLAGCSYSTGARTADDLIDGGNIQVHEPAGGSGGASAWEGDGGSETRVIVLQPLLLDEAQVGLQQVMTAYAYDAAGRPASGAQLTLSWLGGELAAATDVDGAAVFTVVPNAGETEYLVSSGPLTSNAVALEGVSP